MSELDAQRRITAAFIAADPDARTVALIPRARTTNNAGAPVDTDGPPRTAQTFKLSLLAFDQRPTITVAGVERLVDYHLIGPHDMQIAVGDYWMEGTKKYEVVGFSHGFQYETKAFVIEHVPRPAGRP